MMYLLKNYCKNLYPYYGVVFFVVGISVFVLAMGILLINPYKKVVGQLKSAKKSILRKTKRQTTHQKSFFLKKPTCYRDGWNIFCQSQQLPPASCLIFHKKQPCYLFDWLTLAEICCLMPVCLVAGLNESFGWQFFTPILFLSVFLVIFQTHRLLYKYRTEKAEKAHLAFVYALEEVMKQGFLPVAKATTNKKKLELCKTPQISSGFLTNNEKEPPIKTQQPHHLQYLVDNGVEKELANEIANELNAPPEQKTTAQRKRLNEMLEGAFQKVCQDKTSTN